MNRLERIEAALRAALGPDHLEIVDESALHEGHAGARSGRGHFRVTIVAEKFRGLSRIERHRAVYGALGRQMAEEIHALALSAFTPEEWAQRGPQR